MGSLKFGVNFGEKRREQSVARHGVPDAGLAILKNEQRGDHAGEGADNDNGARPGAGAEHLQRIGYRGIRGFTSDEGGVFHHAE